MALKETDALDEIERLWMASLKENEEGSGRKAVELWDQMTQRMVAKGRALGDSDRQLTLNMVRTDRVLIVQTVDHIRNAITVGLAAPASAG